MVASDQTHPSDQTLNDYGLGKLDDPSASTVHEHLEGCEDCRRRVSEFTSDSFLGRFREGHKPSERSIPGGSPDAGTLSFMQSRVASPPLATDTLPPGLADHPDYEIRRELGRGGMGVVYLAHNAMMGRDEVLKVMGRHIIERPGVLERFQREIRAVAKLRHPNIVAAYHAFRIEGGLVFSMEYVEGLDLSRLVKTKGPLSVAHAAYFAHQAALGLQHAYEKGLIHRDIKPHNLMLTHDGKARLVKVLDFGLAKATREEKVDGGLTSEGQALGTPDYIAPEQIVNALDVDIRADLYSLGGTLFYLLTGRPPFQATSLYDIYQAHMSRDAEPLNLIRPEVPAELAALVGKMMAKDPNRRFQRPGEVAEALKPFFKAKPARVAPEISRVEPVQARPLPRIAEETEPATSGPRPITPAKPTAEPAAVEWDRLIDVREPETVLEEPLPVMRPGRPRWLWPSVSAASLLGALLLAWLAGVLKVKTPDGVIVLENVPKDAEVLVDGAKIRLAWAGDDKPLEIRTMPGEHKVQVEKDGFKTFGESVTIKNGGSEAVIVRLERLIDDRIVPEAKGKPPADPGPVRHGNAETPAGKADAEGFISLFNGVNLDGWKTHQSQPGRWRVEDGILIGSGPVSHLYSERGDYKDVHVRVEARINRDGNSGVFVRSSFGPTSGGLAAMRPKSSTSAAITGQEACTVGDKPLVTNSAPLIVTGQWFAMDLIAVGDRVVIKVNGTTTADYKDDNRLFSSGHIALQQNTPKTVIEFRKIDIKEVDREPSEANGFRPLFNGKDLNGWSAWGKDGPLSESNVHQFWSVRDGALHGSGGQSHLFSPSGDYQDFRLKAEVKINDGGNSGIYFRATRMAGFPKGYEAQINSTHRDPIKTGSLYKLVNVNQMLVPPDTWFTLEVEAIGNRIRIWIDGQCHVDTTDPRQAYNRGFIAIQAHSPESHVQIRKLEVMELDPEAGSKLAGVASQPDREAPATLVPPDAKSFQGKRFKVFQEELTWHQAKERCEAIGGHLAIVTSEAESDFVNTSISEAGVDTAWLGATDEQAEGKWLWVDGTVMWVNGRAMGFTNWDTAVKQPNNKGTGEHYLVSIISRAGKWSDQPDRSVERHVGYVCQWDAVAEAAPADAKVPGTQAGVRSELPVTVLSGDWTVEGNDLVQRGGAGTVLLGDSALMNYDLRFQGKIESGSEGFNALFHRTGSDNFRFFHVGELAGKWVVAGLIFHGEEGGQPPREVKIVKGTWYDVLIKVRGPEWWGYLDGRELFHVKDKRFSQGRIGLATWAGDARYREIRVTTPEGKPIWEGPPKRLSR